ncbi:hypothetical protein [Gilvimarinus xylanilyticus]|uniref:Uncharacterized protein n=1 Tax=Gilvimarinus xylanilyticus TaxID=2944139 RepID=A0A9X2I7U5_9GAMM|nr:hypothetical protein [Gilvimarinus xylanilyticus]MCP8900377.1 hypothetical protein [Gilvimarinus xylanilyticus]
MEGEIYTYKATRFRWESMRILKVSDGIAHIRIYKKTFFEPKLSKFKKDSWVIGHLPIAIESLDISTLKYVGRLPIEEDELEGYRIWEEEADAGVFS